MRSRFVDVVLKVWIGDRLVEVERKTMSPTAATGAGLAVRTLRRDLKVAGRLVIGGVSFKDERSMMEARDDLGAIVLAMLEEGASFKDDV